MLLQTQFGFWIISSTRTIDEILFSLGKYTFGVEKYKHNDVWKYINSINGGQRDRRQTSLQYSMTVQLVLEVLVMTGWLKFDSKNNNVIIMRYPSWGAFDENTCNTWNTFVFRQYCNRTQTNLLTKVSLKEETKIKPEINVCIRDDQNISLNRNCSQ